MRAQLNVSIPTICKSKRLIDSIWQYLVLESPIHHAKFKLDSGVGSTSAFIHLSKRYYSSTWSPSNFSQKK
ncbi:hypothetical protein Plhal304r1_c003g0010731 [Plasmopara halstedii]